MAPLRITTLYAFPLFARSMYVADLRHVEIIVTSEK
jgi:hypothetical protein